MQKPWSSLLICRLRGKDPLVRLDIALMVRVLPSRYDSSLCFLFQISMPCSKGIHDSSNQYWIWHKQVDVGEQHISLPNLDYHHDHAVTYNSFCRFDVTDASWLSTVVLWFCDDVFFISVRPVRVLLLLLLVVTVTVDVSSSTSLSLHQTYKIIVYRFTP